MTTNDPLGLLDRAISQTGAIVARVRPEQASLPTPCSEFDVRQLVNHLVYDAQTFTTMLTGAERGSPDADLIGDDWVSVPLVDGLVRFARIEKRMAPKRLKEYVPQTYRKG